jgi:hypothetical protein
VALWGHEVADSSSTITPRQAKRLRRRPGSAARSTARAVLEVSRALRRGVDHCHRLADRLELVLRGAFARIAGRRGVAAEQGDEDGTATAIVVE